MNEDIAPPINESADLERERLNSLINSMGDGVIAIDESKTVVLTNGAALNILDVNGSLTGKSLGTVLNLIDKNNQPVDISAIIDNTNTSTASREWRIKYSNDEIANLYTSIAPVKLGYGKKGMRGYVILIRDITREKSLEEERDEFISVVSHELRTPVAIAEGNVSNAIFLLEKQNISPPITESLKQTYSQIIFLAGMINDLSTLSRAERGKLIIDIEPINVDSLINELVASYTDEAQKKSLQIKAHLDPKLEVLQSSRLYVTEILQNFITNSIKYTQAGHIVVGAIPKTNGIEFYVQDTGIGISKTDKDKVFDKFFRSADFRTKENKGTGLGLYVTMKLAKLINAEIKVETEINVGSTFMIFVPNLK